MGLLDDIAKLTQPAAQLPDLESEDHDGTNAKRPETARTTRAKNLKTSFDDGRYAGAKVSREELFGDMNSVRDDVSEDSGDDSEADDEENVEDMSDVEDEGEAEPAEISEDEEDVDGDVSDEEEGDDEEEKEEDTEIDDAMNGLGKIKMTNTEDQQEEDKNVKKAVAVTTQKKAWDEIMYANIKVHGVLNVCNQLPRGDDKKKLLSKLDDAGKEDLKQAMKNLERLRELMKTACECITSAGDGAAKESDDEEITSDESGDEKDDEEDVADEDQPLYESSDDAEEAVSAQEASKKISTPAFDSFLQKQEADFEKFRSSTLTKWHTRTKLLSTKAANNADFSVFEKGSVLSQISKVLNDKDRLLKKVHTKRGGRERIGADEEATIDGEIFDDADFYQSLLKQMIESKSNNDPSSQVSTDMTRSYIELQKMLNNKKKRDVSQLSSKDRRLKFEPIPKLINFHPAVPEVVTWSHESRNELFKSLFV